MKTKTLILIRHGISESKLLPKPDYDRELVKEGRIELLHNADKNAEYLQKTQLVYCSGSTRTRQTLDVVAPYLNPQGYDIVFNDKIYEKEGYWGDILDLIKSTEEGIDSVCVIGHNPTISELCTYAMHSAYNMERGDIIIITFRGKRKEL